MKVIIDNIENYSDNDYLNFLYNIKLEKRKKIDKLINSIRKKESILGEKMFVDNLFKIYGIKYDEIQIKYTINGKPYINRDNIYYNISHSYGTVVIAFNNTPIGIDIEKKRATNINVINHFATLKEKEYILRDKKDINEKIFKIYTLKEAYFKMKGVNLNNIKKVEFTINNSGILCSNKTISAIQQKYAKDYIISICTYNNTFK